MRNLVAPGLLGRIRLFRDEPPPPIPVFRVVAEGAELAESDLEQVVGGLERAFIPGAVRADAAG